MSRSLKKGPYVNPRLLEKLKGLKPGSKEIIKTWSRGCSITPEMIGFTFGVHNGKEFIPVYTNEDMVGHHLGEFSATTKFVRHGGKMQREIEAKAAEGEAAKVTAVKTETAKSGPAKAAPAKAAPARK